MSMSSNKNKRDKIHYSRNFKLALIASLSIIIFCFTLLPKISLNMYKVENDDSIFNYSDIVPPTLQNETSALRSSAEKPPIPLIRISTAIGEPDLLYDINIPNKTKGQKSSGNLNHSTDNENLSSNSYFASMPRQILEVLPQKSEDNSKGRIDLSLNIGGDGKVKGYKVLDNTTGSEACLKNVIKAVYKSRWEPLTTQNDTASYWLHKSYTFN